ncbi:MAG: crossover junction endodeoxyribonuclease RuvC [Pseudomonadota bacterium]
MTAPMPRILGVDPGSRATGFGVIDSDGRQSRWVASGVIRTTSEAMPARLGEIYRGMRQVVEQHRPSVLAVEAVFMSRNPDSALKLGQARGAAICAGVAGEIGVHEYATRAIKQAVVGTGAATKDQVAEMVRRLLNRTAPLAADEADALAVALCHAHSMVMGQRLARLGA